MTQNEILPTITGRAAPADVPAPTTDASDATIAVGELLTALGLDPDDVASIVIQPSGVIATLYPATPHIRSWTIDGGRLGTRDRRLPQPTA